MDLLDFQGEQLYFEESLNEEAKQCIDRAAENYAEAGSEEPLMRAYFLEPEHPMVLVALYRYFYYQHRLSEALIVSERVLSIFAKRLQFPQDWQDLTETHLDLHLDDAMTMVRFYLLALKGAAYLELRLGDEESAIARLKKLVELDSNDRLGAKALMNVVVYRGPQAVS